MFPEVSKERNVDLSRKSIILSGRITFLTASVSSRRMLKGFPAGEAERELRLDSCLLSMVMGEMALSVYAGAK